MKQSNASLTATAKFFDSWKAALRSTPPPLSVPFDVGSSTASGSSRAWW